MKKLPKLLMTVFVLLMVMILNTGVYATESQEFGVGETPEISDPAIRLSMEIVDQKYPSKAITINLIVISQFDSGKVGIEWKFPSELFLVEGQTRDTASVVSGEKYSINKTFIPKENSSSAKDSVSTYLVEIGVRVNAFVPDKNYLSSTSINFNVNSDLEFEPMDKQYKQDKFVDTAITWGTIIVVITIVITIMILAVKKFLNYLNAEDVEQ